MNRHAAALVCWLVAGPALAGPPPLSEAAAWEPKVFVDEAAGIAADQAAVLTMTREGDGALVLSVGPWVAGDWSARYETKVKRSWPRATVRGRYRTERVAPLSSEVRVTWWNGVKKLGSASLHLASSTAWTAFEFPVRHPSSGARAMTIGVGLGEKTAGRVVYSSITVTDGAPPLGAAPSVANSRPAPPAFIERPVNRATSVDTHRWWLGEAGGAWWLVSPEGRPLYSTGVDAPVVDPPATLAWLGAHGFNSLGGWANVWEWAKALPTPSPLLGFQSLETGTMAGGFDRLVNAKGETCGGEGHAFPDPYDPRFAESYRTAARDVLRAVMGAPWFAAWFADNETALDDLPRCVYSAHAGKAFLDYLRGRYASIDALNRAWTTRFSSFDDILAKKPDPVVRSGPLWDDARAFSREIVKRYVDVTLTVLHEEDPGRLVFSNRFMLESLDDTLAVLDLYARYDGIAVNCYPSNVGPGLSAGERQALTLIHETTGKPILIGEWSVPAIDSGLYNPKKPLDWSWAEVVDTQAERAAQAARVASDFHSLPFVVGAHWFIWKDVDTANRRANRGLFRADGREWVELTTAVGNVQRKFQR